MNHAHKNEKNKKGKDLLMVCNLKGGYMFMADISRWITINCVTDFIMATSYQNDHSTGVVNLQQDLSMDVTNYHILLIEGDH